MAALLAPTPAPPPAPRDRTWVALIPGAAILVSGISVLLVGVVLPDSPSHSMAVPGMEVNQAPAARFDAAYDGVGATGAPPALRFGPVTTQGRLGTDRSSPVLPEADGQSRARTATGCLEPEGTRGTRAESTHLATIPLCGDPREALLMMAAQYRGRGSYACPCPMGAPPYRSSLSNTDDRIAEALFGAASSLDLVPCVPGDLRQDLAQMAPAQPISRCAVADPFLMSGRIAAAQNALFGSSSPGQQPLPN